MPQILQLRVDDSTMAAIAELGKRRYPSTVPDRRGGALGYDRLATLQDIIQAGLDALETAGVPADSETAPIPVDADWVTRLEALERQVSELQEFRRTAALAAKVTPTAPAAPEKEKSSTPAKPAATPKPVKASKPAAKTSASAPSKATKVVKATPSPAPTPTTSSSDTTDKPKPKPKLAAPPKKAQSSSTPERHVTKAKTPSRRRRSSSRPTKEELTALLQAPSLSKNSLASLCRCDKRTLDRKRNDGELGKFTRARCGFEYRYDDKDARYYPATT